MGVIVRQKRKGGPWWVFLNHGGNRKSKCVGDRQTAEAVAKELRKRIAEGEFNLSKSETPTLGQYVEKTYLGGIEARCKFSTGEGYKSNLKNHILPIFGRERLDVITRGEVKAFLFEKLRGLKPRTVRNLVNIISGIMTNAVEDGVIGVNPAVRLGKLIPKQDKKRDVNPFTREEAQIFLDTAQEHYPRYYPLWLTALRTGLRLGELLALQWGDIDFHGGFHRGEKKSPKEQANNHP